MLIAKGTNVAFIVDGVRIRTRGAMLHDPSGRYWPRCSLLFASFKRGGPYTGDYSGPAKDYLGRSHKPRLGSVELPPRALSAWQTVGAVEKIYYTRPGTKAPGKYQHSFNKPRGMMHIVFAAKGTGRAVLRRHGSTYRLDMPGGCIVDDRGIAWP